MYFDSQNSSLLDGPGAESSNLGFESIEIALKSTLSFEKDQGNPDSSPIFEIGSHCVVLAGLEHFGSSTPHSVVSPLDETADVYPHTQLRYQDIHRHCHCIHKSQERCLSTDLWIMKRCISQAWKDKACIFSLMQSLAFSFYMCICRQV